MPNISSNEGFHFCIESDNFDEDYHYLKSACVPVDTLPHPAGARTSTEQTWQRAVFIGPDNEKIEIRG
jgi:lactoylglutathione lyase